MRAAVTARATNGEPDETAGRVSEEAWGKSYLANLTDSIAVRLSLLDEDGVVGSILFETADLRPSVLRPT